MLIFSFTLLIIKICFTYIAYFTLMAWSSPLSVCVSCFCQIQSSLLDFGIQGRDTGHCRESWQLQFAAKEDFSRIFLIQRRFADRYYQFNKFGVGLWCSVIRTPLLLLPCRNFYRLQTLIGVDFWEGKIFQPIHKYSKFLLYLVVCFLFWSFSREEISRQCHSPMFFAS